VLRGKKSRKKITPVKIGTKMRKDVGEKEG
jgi:hypothetical protein